MRIPLLTASAWLLLLLTCTCVGLWVQQRFLKRRLTWENVFEAFWIGWALCIAMLQFWHFVLPVTWLALLVFSLIAGAVFYHMRRSLQHSLPVSSLSWRRTLLYLLMIAIAVFWLITRTMFSASVLDHALYYLQTEKWFSTFPIVPGLGNLHGRLAFNSSYFLFTSLFQTWFGVPRAFHVGNGLLMLVLLAQVVQGTVGIFHLRTRAALWQWFCLFTLFPLLQQLALNWRIGWSNDFPTFVLGIIMAIQVLKLLEHDEKSSSEMFYRLGFLTLLSAIGITIKLSFAVWCLSLLGLVLAINWRMFFVEAKAWRRLGLLVVVMLVMLVPWVARNIVLSGYLVYPITPTAVPVSWRVPAPAVDLEAQAIYGWARLPNANWAAALNSWDWLDAWIQRVSAQSFEVVLPIGLAVLALARIVIFRWRFQHFQQPNRIIPLAASLSLVYWFLTAPDVRFAGSLFWLLANGLLVIALTTLPRKYWLGISGAVVSLAAVFILRDLGAFTERGAANAPMETPALQSASLGTYTVYFPVSGELCGDAPIPCAQSAPDPRLRLRTPDNLAHGFWFSETP